MKYAVSMLVFALSAPWAHADKSTCTITSYGGLGQGDAWAVLKDNQAVQCFQYDFRGTGNHKTTGQAQADAAAAAQKPETGGACIYLGLREQ